MAREHNDPQWPEERGDDWSNADEFDIPNPSTGFSGRTTRGTYDGPVAPGSRLSDGGGSYDAKGYGSATYVDTSETQVGDEEDAAPGGGHGASGRFDPRAVLRAVKDRLFGG